VHKYLLCQVVSPTDENVAQRQMWSYYYVLSPSTPCHYASPQTPSHYWWRPKLVISIWSMSPYSSLQIELCSSRRRNIQYRSRGTYTRASSASDCTREFESVKLDKRRSSTRALERSHSSTGALALELHSKPAPLALERSHTYRSTARHVALVYTLILSW
jgi:hypothetical protein